MAIYNAPLIKVDAKETRRYAGLARAQNFSEAAIEAACEEAQLLAEPRGCWQIYAYDGERQSIAGDVPFILEGKKINDHLSGCERAIVLAATVGEAIEQEVTRKFAAGEYTAAVLLDAAATAAVEQVADAMEGAMRRQASAEGFAMRWRFSPGYGDWPLTAQPEMIRLSGAAGIGLSLTESLMLFPRKSITAIIGLCRGAGQKNSAANSPQGCAACNKLNCPSRKE